MVPGVLVDRSATPAEVGDGTTYSPAYRPAFPEFDGNRSYASLCIESGPAVTLWSAGRTENDPAAETSIKLYPDQCAVIGRQQGGENEYLDPQFSPTRLVPGTGQSVLTNHGHGYDTAVSRGHFTLRGAGRGIILINGVPRRGGGIRPPVNGTIMIWPTHRRMGPGEEVWIEPGNMARIQLPNLTIISIKAD